MNIISKDCVQVAPWINPTKYVVLPKIRRIILRQPGGVMSERQKHIDQLFTAELQFRLASAVRLATTQRVTGLEPKDL